MAAAVAVVVLAAPAAAAPPAALPPPAAAGETEAHIKMKKMQGVPGALTLKQDGSDVKPTEPVPPVTPVSGEAEVKCNIESSKDVSVGTLSPGEGSTSKVAGPEACCAKCTALGEHCRAWAFHSDTGECRLFSSVASFKAGPATSMSGSKTVSTGLDAPPSRVVGDGACEAYTDTAEARGTKALSARASGTRPECCADCQNTAGCKAWTFDEKGGMCHLWAEAEKGKTEKRAGSTYGKLKGGGGVVVGADGKVGVGAGTATAALQAPRTPAELQRKHGAAGTTATKQGVAQPV